MANEKKSPQHKLFKDELSLQRKNFKINDCWCLMGIASFCLSHFSFCCKATSSSSSTSSIFKLLSSRFQGLQNRYNFNISTVFKMHVQFCVTVLTGKFLTKSESAISPLMYHRNLAAGLERREVQLTSTLSPMWYLGKPPVIMGPSSGRSTEEKKIENTDLSRGNSRVVNPRPFINVPITYFFSFSCLKTTRALRSGVAVASLEATEAAAAGS